MSTSRQQDQHTTASTRTTTEAFSQTTRPTLRLRGESIEEETQVREQPTSRRIRWDENVVNNEGMGKKSSKVCCIYHKPRAPGESSSESSSSESSSDDTDAESEASTGPRPRAGGSRYQHDGPCSNHRHHDKSIRKKVKNAYEKTPKSNSNVATEKNTS